MKMRQLERGGAMDVDEGDPLWSPDIELDATYMKTGDDDESERGEKPR